MADDLLLPASIDPKSRETIDERVRAEKVQFLAALREVPIIQVAASKVGIHRSTYYDWRKNDSEFASQADEALQEGIARICDLSESKMIAQIHESNMTAIIFWLKSHSKIYAVRPNVLITPTDNKAIGKVTVSWNDEKEGKG